MDRCVRVWIAPVTQTYAPPPAPGAPPPDQRGRIVVDELTKVFGGKIRAVDRLSFSVEPGSVTGFLGPNGAGKTTTLRMMLGLVRPTGGNATIGGVPYRQHPQPDDRRRRRARSRRASIPPAPAATTCASCAPSPGCPIAEPTRCSTSSGCRDAARRKVRGYSMGMRQRLGLAAALLGDPHVLLLDEPANGLDPEGIRWLRGLFRHLAGEGRTVLVSSHQLNEVQEFADRVVILNRGPAGPPGVDRRTDRRHRHRAGAHPAPGALIEALAAAGHQPDRPERRRCAYAGSRWSTSATSHSRRGVELHELSTESFDLEELFFALTEGATPARTGGSAARRAVPAATTRPGSTARPPAPPVPVPPPSGRCAVVGLIRAEFRKLRTTQVWFWMLLVCSRPDRAGRGRQIAR